MIHSQVQFLIVGAVESADANNNHTTTQESLAYKFRKFNVKARLELHIIGMNIQSFS